MRLRNIYIGTAVALLAGLGVCRGATSLADLKAIMNPPAPTAECTVYEDANDNGKRDPGEKGLAGVRVSDGVNFVTTDAEGACKFERMREARFVYVETPTGWRSRKFYREVKALGKGETARDTMEFALARDGRGSGEDAPAIAHVADVRRAGTPDEAARQRLWTVLRHVRKLNPQPSAVVIVGSLKGCADRMQVVESMGDLLPRVYYVYCGAGDETDGKAAEEMFREKCGPTSYSFGAGKALFMAGTGLVDFVLKSEDIPAPVLKNRKLVFLSEARALDISQEKPAEFETEGLEGDEGSGDYRLMWGDGTSREVWALDKPLWRWVYPVSGGAAGMLRLRMLATAYDSTDASRTPTHAAESWRLARLAGEPGRMKLAELDTKGRALTGVARRTLAKPGPFADPGLWVIRLAGLPGMDSTGYTVSFEATGEEAGKCDLSTPWSGPGGNDLHTGAAPATVTPPLKLAGWGQMNGAPMLVMEGKCLVPGEEIGGAFRWADPKSEAGGETAAGLLGLQRRTSPRPTMNDEAICWVSKAGELTWIPTTEAPIAEAANTAMKRWKLDAEGAGARGIYTRISPAAVGNVGMAVTPRGEAVGVDLKNGRELWRTPGVGACTGPVGTEEGFVLGNACLSVRTGKAVWKMEGPGFVTSEVSVLGKRVVVTGLVNEKKPGKLTQTAACFETETGKQLWRVRLGEVEGWETVRTPGATLGAGRAFVGSAKGTMSAIDLETGEVRWEAKTGASMRAPSAEGKEAQAGPITARAVFSEGVVYFAGQDGIVQGYDAKKGKKVFSFDVGMPVVDDLAISGNSLMVATCDGMVFWFTPAVTGGRTGEQARWRRTVLQRKRGQWHAK